MTLKFHMPPLVKGQEGNDSDRVCLGVPRENIKRFESHGTAKLERFVMK